MSSEEQYLYQIIPREGQWPSHPMVRQLAPGMIGVPSLESIIERLKRGLFRWPYVEVTRDGKAVPPNQYSTSKALGAHFKNGLVDWERVHELVHEGHVVAVHRVEHWNAEFAEFIRGMGKSGPLQIRSKVLIGQRLCVQEELGDAEIAGTVVFSLEKKSQIVITSAHKLNDDVTHDQKYLILSSGAALLVPPQGNTQLSLESMAFGGALLVQLLMPTQMDALSSIVECFLKSADPDLTSKYHRLGVQERNRRTRDELARIVSTTDTSTWIQAILHAQTR